MSIHRTGPTPVFLEYILNHCLIPKVVDAPSNLLAVLEGVAVEWVDIPNYQRGIAWDVKNVEELLKSNSVLLGNVIMGQFPRPAGVFPRLHAGIINYAILVDGLQRFSVGTALLSVLYPRVLSDSPTYANLSGLFTALRARSISLAAIFQYNNQVLSNYPRQAVSDAYVSFFRALEKYADERLQDPADAPVFASEIGRLFLSRQIATDMYFNFSSAIQLTNTFIGINTVRVDLSPVDLLRSYIVDRAMTAGWNPADIEEMENRFTEIFTDGEKPKTDLLPFVNICLDKITAGPASVVFPSWSALTADEVDDFLDFVEAINICGSNPYLNEIRAIGAIPFAGILCHYYRVNILMNKGLPSFIGGGSLENEELHRFLCANYRAFLKGKVAKSRFIAERLICGEIISLADASELMSTLYLSANLDSTVDADWLRQALRSIDKKKAPRVFNAMLLPARENRGGSFAPQVYGNASVEHHIDHLLPASVVNRNAIGAPESDTLINFAPLRSDLNREAKATPCSRKLCSTGLYDNYIRVVNDFHPYCEWLVQAQSSLGSDLDRQELLVPNQTPDIVTDRLNWFVDQLLLRL